MGDIGGRDDLDAQWDRVKLRLRREFGDQIFVSWIEPMKLGEFRDGRLRLMVKTRFMSDWVKSKYHDRILAAWQAENKAVRWSIEIIVEPAPVAGPPIRQLGASASPVAASPEPIHSPTRQSLPHAGPSTARDPGQAYNDLAPTPDPRLTFDSFVVGPSNQFAFAAARKAAEGDRPAFNPLYLLGGVGQGKTHLMHAIWHGIRANDPRRKVIYLSAEAFVNRFIQALKARTTPAFKDMFRGCDVLMVDDVQFICGKEHTQEEFFYTFNSLIEQGKQIVLSSERPPSELGDIEERMKSRLGSGLVAEIHSTPYELRLGILQSKAELAKVPVSGEVMELLAQKITSNVRELEGALNRIVHTITLVGKPLSLQSAQEVLHDVLKAADRRVTIDEIQNHVCQYYNIKMAEMSSPRRSRSVARPRQVAMYLCKQLTTHSLPQIGRKFGNRDHTTVMHAVKKITELKGSDNQIAEDVDHLTRRLQN